MKPFNVYIVPILELVIRAVFGLAPNVDIAVSLWSDKIFLGEKNVVNNTFLFPEKMYKSVKVTLYPTLDVPDMVITKVTKVTVGANLVITGSKSPVMDFGIKKFQVPGRALSCEFDFGNIIKIGKARVPADETIMIEYEAIVPEDRFEGFDAGHNHQLGASVEVDDKNYVIGFKNAMFTYRSLPLLFKAHVTKGRPDRNKVTEMVQLAVQKKETPRKNVFSY